MSPSNPFVAGARLQDLQKFVGREEELRAIAGLMSGDQPTSVNLVGDRRIGKSSLLYYFFRTWKQRVLNHSNYVVIYLSLQLARCQRENNFYQAVVEELLDSDAVAKKTSLVEGLSKIPVDRLAFSEAIAQFKEQGLLPVLCLDDFDSLFKYPQEFDNGFYDSLRAMMDNNAIMLVIVSRKPLEIHGEEHRFVSGFFNLGHTIELRELTIDEAIALTRLTINTNQGKQPALSLDEQNYAQQWGKRNPYLLQLAGLCLYEAQQNGQDIKWARKKFEQQINKSRSRFIKRFSQYWWQWLLLVIGLIVLILAIIYWTKGGIFAIPPIKELLGTPLAIGNVLDDIAKVLIGIIVLALPILFVTGKLSWKDFLAFVSKIIKKALPWEELKEFFQKLSSRNRKK
ncbi:MAG: AAA family ATPase [Calothrix sp. CSU_2_0]|nr:AAA family ATPase [Calothrix sp. CSU_2_0]